MNSIVSYPSRGAWGNSKWRGNSSGHVYKDLFEQLKPQTFVDPMMGSGTAIEVANEMGIEAFGFDLHMGFNALSDSILQAVGKPADLVVSHPPYSAMIRYSGSVWGDKAHPDDLSQCENDEDFHRKLQLVLLNQREATKGGGYYGALIGDWRRGGVYTSYQAEMIARMPNNELAAVIIKAQHNCLSDSNTYASMKLPRIIHEYLVLWQKKASPILVVLRNLATAQANRLAGTWLNIVRTVLSGLGKSASLDAIYKAVESGAPERLATNPNWKAKVRQILNQNAAVFSPVDRGIWAISR